MRSFIAVQRRGGHEARDFLSLTDAAKLAEIRILFTERFVFKPAVLVALLLAAGLSSAAISQPAANGNVPRTDYIAQMDLEFGKMDADKNGKVSRAEIEAYDRAMAVATARARAQATFAQLDIDHNGQVNQTEFMKLVTGTPPADGRPLIAKLDSNKDGQISLVEHRAGKLSYFDQIDTDKDGVVTIAEMRAAGVVK